MTLLMLLVHGLGLAGLLNGWTVGGLAITGLVAAFVGDPEDVRGGLHGTASVGASGWVALVGTPVALLLVAASLPPGVLWPMEAKGYDALEYHLQIPREWYDAGAIGPLLHNSYSFLPLNVESLYLALMHARGGAMDAMLACQWLSASFAFATAGLLALEVRERTTDAGAGALAAAAFLFVPGVLVTGSLAYNETGMLFLLTGALLLANDGSPARAGALVGGAIGVKLSAVALGFPAVLVAVWLQPGDLRARLRAAVACGLGAAGLFVPILLRNLWWTGNPVFPMAAGWLGSGHWTSVSQQRWSTAHDPTGSLIDRIARLWPDALGSPHFHPAWWLAAALAVGALLVDARTRRAGRAWLAMMAVQVAAWVSVTHTAGRFLLPVAIPASLAIGAAAAQYGSDSAPAVRRICFRSAAGVAIMALVWGQFALWREATEFVPGLGPADFVRDITAVRDLYAPPDAERERLLLLGEARAFYFPSGTRYHVAFEEGEFARACRAHPQDPRAVIDDLRARGITALYVNWPEVDRLHGTYGLDPEISRDMLAALAAAGAVRSSAWGSEIAELYRLPDR